MAVAAPATMQLMVGRVPGVVPHFGQGALGDATESIASVDVSGSMDEALPAIYAALVPLAPHLHPKVDLFSTVLAARSAPSFASALVVPAELGAMESRRVHDVLTVTPLDLMELARPGHQREGALQARRTRRQPAMRHNCGAGNIHGQPHRAQAKEDRGSVPPLRRTETRDFRVPG